MRVASVTRYTNGVDGSTEGREGVETVLRRLLSRLLVHMEHSRAAYERLRRRWRLVDEIHRSYNRYYELRLNRLAGSAVYFGFLAALPFVLLLFFAMTSVAPQPATHQAGDTVQDALSVVTGPGVHGLRAVWNTVLHAVLATFGISGLVYAAWSWLEALRHAVSTAAGRIETRRSLRDFGTATTDLLLAGPGLLVSVLLAWSFTTTPYRLLDLAHVNVPERVRGWLEGEALVLCLLWSTLLWYLIYPRLARVPTNRARTLAAAIATSLSVGLLLEVGMMLVKANSTHPFFGLLVMIFGLLLWVSVAVRLVVAIGTWLTLPPPVVQLVDLGSGSAASGAASLAPAAAPAEAAPAAEGVTVDVDAVG